MFCSKCGVEMAENSAFCPSCGARVGAAPEAPPPAQYPMQPASMAKFPSTALPGLVIAAVGAIAMLIALAFDWYTMRFSGLPYDYDGPTSENLAWGDLSDLVNSDLMGEYVFNYAGTILPLILIIVLSAIVLVSLLYSFASGKLLNKLWYLLGSLCILLLGINFAYLLIEFLSLDFWDFYFDIGGPGYYSSSLPDITMYITPHAGWIVAFIGALAVIIGSSRAKQTLV